MVERRTANSRAARLEAQLRANLKKRKEQARARARSATDANEETAGAAPADERASGAE